MNARASIPHPRMVSEADDTAPFTSLDVLAKHRRFYRLVALQHGTTYDTQGMSGGVGETCRKVDCEFRRERTVQPGPCVPQATGRVSAIYLDQVITI